MPIFLPLKYLLLTFFPRILQLDILSQLTPLIHQVVPFTLLLKREERSMLLHCLAALDRLTIELVHRHGLYGRGQRLRLVIEITIDTLTEVHRQLVQTRFVWCLA